jgi:DNA-binding CsgD family transcriptional regulator
LRELNSGAALAHNGHRVGVLSAVTGGDLARSQRWRESLERYGTGDELRVLAADERGCWGRFDLWRDRGDPPFGTEEVRLVRGASAVLGRGMRRATVGLRDDAPAAPLETGVLMIGADLRPLGGTPAIYAWFRALNPAGMPYPGGIPSLVWSTVGRLVAAEAGEDTQRPVRIRVRAADGSWAVIETARLHPNREIAVSVHAAGIGEILGLVSRAYGLSNRQRELVTLVAQGQDTPAIAGQMFISRYTVQDHLKSIFGKLGVHSRLELLTRLFAQAA